MEWAPSEYSKDKRTFSTHQVFDLGVTIISKNDYYDGGFQASYYSEQHGAVPRRFPAGANLRFVFYVTADNYHKEKDFCFEIVAPQSAQGTGVKPATVNKINYT